MKKWAGRLLMGTLCLCLLSGNIPALGEETTPSPTPAAQADDADQNEILEDPAELAGEADAVEDTTGDAVRYTAVASVALKVRREAARDALGNGSIDKDDIVYVIALGNEWSRVDTGRNVGYVLTQYLTDIREYDGGTTHEESEPVETAVPDNASDTPDGFEENFVAYAYKAVVARAEMDERSSSRFRVAKYKEVTVSANYDNGWSYIRYKNSYGYVPTDALFKWDRINPYAGDIPGCVKHIGLAFVNHTTNIRSYDDNGNEVLKTINPGSALSVDTLDGQGRYPLPYWRTTGYVDESDVGYLM
ncbi:MAG: hypothetical protein PHY64_14900, partial [Eubacteriales bacterium]|nr:hypothetical protein [Eubacteriales bacterium]